MSERLPERLFERLTPPPGGLRSLRHRLAEEEHGRRLLAGAGSSLRLRGGLGVGLGVSLSAACLALALVLGPGRLWGPRRSTPATRVAAMGGAGQLPPGLVALGLAPAPAEPVVVAARERGRAAVARASKVGAPVVVYWVAGSEEGVVDQH